jgi:aldehyde dehydrogenase (NAD+)
VTEVKSTVERLRATFESGRTKSYEWRASQLDALALFMKENEKAIVGAVIADHRREPSSAWMADHMMVCSEIDHARKHLKSWMRPQRASLPITLMPGKAWTQHEPLGVSLIIAPWNYPVQLSISPLVGAIAAGNCAVLKPSEIAPHTSIMLAELLPVKKQ